RASMHAALRVQGVIGCSKAKAKGTSRQGRVGFRGACTQAVIPAKAGIHFAFALPLRTHAEQRH
ncbi:MAG TPA: hypothetical protein VIT66_14305, partial [Lysobacter sp.]